MCSSSKTHKARTCTVSPSLAWYSFTAGNAPELRSHTRSGVIWGGESSGWQRSRPAAPSRLKEMEDPSPRSIRILYVYYRARTWGATPRQTCTWLT